MSSENPSEDVLRSRMLGVLYGMAACDALGGPYEFRRRGSYQPSPDMAESWTFTVGGKPLAPGSWTDDSSMGLCLAESLTAKLGLDWKDAADRWARWYTDGEPLQI